MRYFLVNCALHPCELVATSPSPALILQRFSTSFFRKISIVFAQTMYFLEISALRGKTPPSLSLKISPSLSLKTSFVLPQKSPPQEVQRGLVIVFRGRPSQRCSSASFKTRGDSLKTREHQHTPHRKISGTSISSACKRANRSSPSAVSEKRILRLSSLHICRLMSLRASAEAITLEALELVSPRASATSPAVCEERALRVQSNIASLRFKS